MNSRVTVWFQALVTQQGDGERPWPQGPTLFFGVFCGLVTQDLTCYSQVNLCSLVRDNRQNLRSGAVRTLRALFDGWVYGGTYGAECRKWTHAHVVVKLASSTTGTGSGLA
jgi:hypothetical protein